MGRDKCRLRLICLGLIIIVLCVDVFFISLIMKDKEVTEVIGSNITEISNYSIKNKKDIYNYRIENLNYSKDKVKKEPNIDKIGEEISDYLKQCDGEIGLVFYDINREKTISINEEEEFAGASTYKVFMNIVAYETLKYESGSLEDIIYYSDIYYEGGTGILQGENFSYLDLQTLLDYSIIYSDNIATNMVTGYLGGFYNVLYTIGEVLDENICVSDNIITPNQMFAALKFIYENKDEEYYSHMIETMTETIFNDRIDKNLPKDIVAHKIGTYGLYIHDAAIVLLKDNPYILVIYTFGVDDADNVISTISDIIYSEYNSL